MTSESPSLISDDLLRHLMAVGQVDVLVGLPTLDNATTVAGIVRAVHVAFLKYFPRERTVLLNSDGGSTDGTPDVVRDAAPDDADTVLASHALRTVHRISAPYHGLPGKGTAIRTLLAAGDLLQARAIALVDPEAATTPEHIAALLRPVLREGLDLVVPTYRRAPEEGLLVSQFVRPVMRAAYGVRLTEPLGAEFGCSPRAVAQSLDMEGLDSELAQAAIDLWVRASAIAAGLRVGEVVLDRPEDHARPRLPVAEILQQVVGAVLGCLEAHAASWTGRTRSEPLPRIGDGAPADPRGPVRAPADPRDEFARSVQDLEPVLAKLLEGPTFAALQQLASASPFGFDDELWVQVVYELLAAAHRREMRRDHVSQALVPLYRARAAAFLIDLASNPAAGDGDARLEQLSLAFERAKPRFIDLWSRSA